MTWLGPDTGWMDLHMLYIETVWAGDLAVGANHMDYGQMDAIDTGLAILEISFCLVSIPNICALCPPCKTFPGSWSGRSLRNATI